MNHRALIAALASCAIFACGPAPATLLPDGGTAGGATGGGAGTGGGSAGGGADTGGLYINAALGLNLVQSPITQGLAPEGALKGTVMVSQNDVHGPAVPAKLTVNGVEIPQQAALGVFFGYDFSKANLTSIKPGDALTLHAELDGGSATITAQCPPEVSITAPAEGTQAAAGDMITVQWSGSVDHSTPIKPDIMVYGYDPATGAHVRTDLPDRVESGKTSDTFALPDSKGEPQWSVELYVTGDLVQRTSGTAWCGLLRRVHLIKR